MSDNQSSMYQPFDELLSSQGPVVLAGKQILKVASFDGENTEIVFPPSYANPSEKKDDPAVYNIDELDPKDPSKNVCVLDSIPSQANRTEPLFGEPPYDGLVPQYKLQFNNELPVFNITQIGHRIADAAFRGTTLRPDIVTAFKEYSKGNAKKLADIGPTSLIFGAWDSRGTGVKVPRLINSIIRAFNVQTIKRSAQYSPPIKYEQEGMVPVGIEGKPADHGLADVPSSHKIGGVQVFGEIRRDFTLNLELLRDLKGANEEETRKLQRYVLGLSLLAFTATQKTYLRQGCQLLPNGEPTWLQFKANGTQANWSPPNDIPSIAQSAAADFGVKQPTNQPLVFDKNLLKETIDTDLKAKTDKKASNESDTFAELLKLVTALTPDASDTFPKGKKDPITKLDKEIKKTLKGNKTSEFLKETVTKLEALAVANSGAASRKAEMLALLQQLPGEMSSEGGNS